MTDRECLFEVAMAVERDSQGRPLFFCPKCGWQDYVENRDLHQRELCPECLKDWLHKLGIPYTVLVERF